MQPSSRRQSHSQDVIAGSKPKSASDPSLNVPGNLDDVWESIESSVSDHPITCLLCNRGPLRDGQTNHSHRECWSIIYTIAYKDHRPSSLLLSSQEFGLLIRPHAS